MDLTSKSTYDTFKDEIWKELGPLDPNWFDVLTSQTFPNEGNVADQDELCANKERNFKTPFETAVESQLFSTPRVFRRDRVVSPEPEDEQFFTNEQEKEALPWTATQSPYLFRMSKEGVPGGKYGGMQPQSQDSFNLLQIPETSPVSYAKQISESLGAQIHPDISWTSSLNTPPAVPSTLILSKTDESPFPVSVSADRNVVIVRKLFPSLSNASRIGGSSPRNTDMPALHKGLISPVTDQNPEPHDSPQSSLNQSEGVWRQKLPDAIEDGEIRSTVASVLDGAENVLSIFFSNSSSTLRKVKTERNKRKQIIPTKEEDCSSTNISETNNTASNEQRMDDQETGKCLSPLGKTALTGISQWSPLSLSEIPPCTVDTSCCNNPATQTENKYLTEQLHSDSRHLVRPPLTTTDSGLTKKKRKFIYTVETLKSQVQEKEKQSQKKELSTRIPDFGYEVSVKQLGNVRDEAACCTIGENDIQKQGNVKDSFPSSIHTEVQDLDMSQLCKDFAEDFTQMSDLSKLSKVAEDPPQNNFSPSACLSAMKQAKQKAKQPNLYQDSDGIRNTRHVATNPNFSISGGTVSDSGFQSAVADISHVTTSFVLPSLENNCQTQSGFEADTHRTACSLSTNKETRNAHLDDILQETDANLFSTIKESKLDSGTESGLHKDSMSTQLPRSVEGTVDNINCILLNGHVNGRLPEKTIGSLPSIHATGFKTASNKGIDISSASLERAKCLFQENEAERTFSDQPTKCAHDTKIGVSLSHGSVNNSTSKSNQLQFLSERCGNVSCQLTESQKADVTELCTLLEEADSQFEFTQFRTAKLKPHCKDNTTSLQRTDKELDPDFLTGIDFDDSFTSDAEKLPDKLTTVSNGKTYCDALKITSKSMGISVSSVARKENSSTEDVSSSLNHISDGSMNIMSAEPKTLTRADNSEINKQGNKNPSILGVGFKTAGGNVCEIHAKTEQGKITSITDKDATKGFKNGKLDTTTCQNRFQMASGKGISISAKAMHEADAFFKDCILSDWNTDMSVKHKKSIEPLPGSVNHKKNLPELKNVKGIKDNFSEEQIGGFDNINSGPAAYDSSFVQANVKIHTPALTNAVSFHENQSLTVKTLSSSSRTEFKDIGSATSNELNSGGGFSTASGKKVSVSAEAMQKENGETKQLKDEGDSLRPNYFNQMQLEPSRNGGFQTASGKGVVISSAALKKAKSLLNECEAIEENSVKPTNSKMPVPGPPHKHCGFYAASGKPVAFSAEVLQKAKALFSDIDLSEKVPAVLDTRDPGEMRDSPAFKEFISSGAFCTASLKKVSKANSLSSERIALEDTNKKRKHCEDTLPFQTASGKRVAISSAALKKAKRLFSECSSDESGVRPVYSKIPVPGPQSGNIGFHAASGKPVALSAEALQKAKALFSDISFSPDIPAVSDARNGDKTQNNDGEIHYGFMTAGGATVHVSQQNLLKAKNLFKEFDEGSISDKTIQPDANVDPGFGCAEFEHVRPAVNCENVLRLDDMEINKGVFKNTPDSTNSTSLHENPSLIEKPISSQVPIGSCAFSEFSSASGFCTASRKKSVSDDTMTNVNCLLNESTVCEDTNKKDTLPPQNSGFQTASGKGVSISSAALKKAKTLLSECERVDDKIGVKPTNSQMPFPGPPHRNTRFHESSDEPMALSSQAVQKVKPRISDISFSAEIPAVSETKKTDGCDGSQDSTQEIHCGFTTAGGEKVSVSQKSLMKAKNLLKEISDGDYHDSNSHSTSPLDTYKSDQTKLKDVKRTSNFNLATVSDLDVSDKVLQVCQSFASLQQAGQENEILQILDSSLNGVKDKKPTNAFKCKEGKTTTSAVDSWHGISPGEISGVLDHEVSQAIFNKGSKFERREESAFLVFQSPNFSSCSETQQRFLAQEALDCTRALLEDEDLADPNISVTLENVPLQDNPKSNKTSEEEQKGSGKRSADDADMTGQPPLKRRLLEEFDRTVDGSRQSTLHPEKSCPKGVMDDRRVFKYSDSLHPNIIKPHRNGTTYVETRLQKTTPTKHPTPGDTRSARSKMPVFVSPFHKKSKTQTRTQTVRTDNMRTPAFIPPFKKQRTVVQENSSEAPEEDLHQRPFVTPSKSNTYLPPTKKTHSTEDLIDNKSKDDIQTVALVHSTNVNQMTNQNLPVGCGSEDSVAEAQGVDDTILRNQDMLRNLESLELARDMQDMRIRKKKRQNIRPLPGSLFLTKTSGLPRISLKAAVNGKPPARYTQKQLYGHGVQQHVSEITSETAEHFRFNLRQFLKQEAFIDCGGVQLGDGGWLITSNDGTAGKEEFYRAICDTPGVDPKLISEEWVYNHYRWIVWKQASMERSFPETMGSLCLNPEQILLQLKYRYDVEVDHSRRPALRKIMERDDTAAKTLVLCVCGVVSRGQSPNRKSHSVAKTPQGADGKRCQVENPSAIIWLTDGWYAIKAQLDEPLTAMLHKGRLAIGGKLIIHGAQLVGSQDACSPLEAPESLMLKICANSSRPARWDTKLGFYRDPRPFLLPVSCLYSNGGPVGCVDIIILRNYPIQWMERKSDGGIVFRSSRAEEKEARRYNSQKHKAMEILFAKIQDEFEREEKGNNKSQSRRRTISRQDIESLQDGEELYEAVGDDPAYLEAHLSEQQLETLHTYRRCLMEKKQAELQDRYRRALETEDKEGSHLKRDVTPVWRLSVADSMDQPGSVYQLNLWRPSSDLQSLLKEGCRYKVFNLTTSDGKKRSVVETIQLTGTNKTQFQDLQTSRECLSARFQPRVSTSFVDLQNIEFQPLCGEVDLTGCVISIVDGQGSSPAFYLVDGNLNFVKVRCFNSLTQAGLEDVVKPCVLLALSNLQLRGQSTSPTPVVYAGDLTVFSTNPKDAHLQESLSQLRSLVQGHENFFPAAEEKLLHLIKSDGLSSVSSPALPSTSPASTTDRRRDTKTNVISQQPVRSLGSFTPVSRNLPAATSSTEKDPRSLKRRRALDYLSRIPSPPSLSYLNSVASPCVNKTFNPPRRSATPSTLKTVQTPARKPLSSSVEDEWVNDEELAMIDTQALHVGDIDT